MTMALAFLKRDLSINLSYRLSFLFQLGGVFFSLATFYFVARVFGGAMVPQLEAYGGDYFAFVVIGLALTGYMALGLTGLAENIRTGQTMGTLELMFLTPGNLVGLLLSSTLWSYLWASLQVFLYLVLGALVFKADLSHANPLSAVLVLLLSIAVFSAIGIISAAFVLILKKGDPIAWAIGSVSALLGGVLYPVTVLPGWLERLSALIPLTYSLRAIRLAVLQGYSFSQLRGDLLALLLFATVLVPVSVWAFRAALRQARKEGSLGHY